MALITISRPVLAEWTSPRRLWLTADGSRVVEDGHQEAATLLVGAGGAIPIEVAERYGLVETPV